MIDINVTDKIYFPVVTLSLYKAVNETYQFKYIAHYERYTVHGETRNTIRHDHTLFALFKSATTTTSYGSIRENSSLCGYIRKGDILYDNGFWSECTDDFHYKRIHKFEDLWLSEKDIFLKNFPEFSL